MTKPAQPLHRCQVEQAGFARLELDEEDAHRLTPWRQQRLEPSVDGRVHGPVAHMPAVDEGVQTPRRRLAVFGRGDDSMDADAQAPLLYWKKVGMDLCAERGGDALCHVAGAGRKTEQHPAGMLEAKGDTCSQWRSSVCCRRRNFLRAGTA